MIQGNGKTESTYREVYMDSSSSLKDFSLDRKKYFRKYIANEVTKDDDTQSSVMGKVVETLLLEPEEFDARFYLSACASSPSGLMLKFVEALYEVTRMATNEDGEITRTFEELSRDAYMKSGFKIPYERVIKNFAGSDDEIYYNEILKVRTHNLTVITADDILNGEKVVEELKSNPITAGIVNLTDSDRYTIKNQWQIEGFTIDGHLLKGMLDKAIIDHKEKSIRWYDLKCVWAVENFYEEYYLYRRAYIQAYLYYQALLWLTAKEDSEVYGYTVELPRFIVCDSTNYYSPLIYELSEEDLKDAYNGFTHKYKEYPGVKSIIADLVWALGTNTWNISRTNYFERGYVKISSCKK